MTELENFIHQHCPDGVQQVKLGDIIEYLPGGALKREEVLSEGKYPVMNGGLTYSGYYENYNYDSNVLTISHWGSSAGHIHLHKSKFWANNACWVFRPKEDKNILLNYLYYALKADEVKIMEKYAFGGATPNLSRQEFNNHIISLPPMPIQEKIVNILDTFCALDEDLSTELKDRKKQYEYYRNKLFSDDLEDDKIEWKPLSEVGTFIRGRRFVRTDIVEDGQPCIHYGDMYTYYGLEAKETRTHLPKDFPVKLRYAEKGDVVIVGAGENDWDIGVGLVWLGNEPVAVHDACYIFKHNMNPKYVAHYLRSEKYHTEIRKHVSSAKICAISPEGIGKAMFPVRTLEQQDRIVRVLDTFEMLVNDLFLGLPAEIKLVQQQYEFYRNKLLTFN